MDDLDRVYHQLVETMRERGSLEAPVAIRELHERLIPYRRVRDAVGFRTNGDYEAALSRLLAGERGYLLTDANEMRSAVREGLDAPIPDCRRYRGHPRATVRLNPSEIPPPGDRRFAPPGAREVPPTQMLAPGDGPSESGVERGAAAEDPGPGEEPAEPDSLPPLTVDSGAADDPSDSHLTPGPQLWKEEEGDRGSTAAEAAPPGVSGGSAPGHGLESARRAGCPDCGARFPGRQVNYCPYCGVLVNRDACRACGTDLEPDWRYCPGCGRRRDTGPEPPAPSA